MGDTISEFFQQLADQGHQPLLGKLRGTVRFDLVERQGGADQWLLAINRCLRTRSRRHSAEWGACVMIMVGE